MNESSCNLYKASLFSYSKGVSNPFLQRASYKFENVARDAYKKLVIMQTLNDKLKLSFY